MSLIVFLAVSGLVLAWAYRWYGRILASYLQLDPATKTPAHEQRDGLDYEPAKTSWLLPQHFSAIAAAALAHDFESGVYAAASLGGAADSRAAIAGALLGGEHGTVGIPQPLIDGLEGRMYIMLAAPWFAQTIQLKSSFWRSAP